MTIYSIYAREADAQLEAVPDRFSWFAALLPPVYALVHGLWLALLGYIVAVVALAAASPWIDDEAATWLYVIFAVCIGFEASTIRRWTLSRRGFAYGGERIAAAEDLAAISWLGHHSQPK